ncbi:Uncharacterized conserved protein, Ntn-hydrolase superfamily [Salinimicrobium catena]|uniref:Uncharacterized conserved protein, Ntn-hydrolase superfamily n=1 Tax=Salinimicrobium catena TaxID=390640 RepID=A0A1H5I5M0_9FLAO|nr:DUF1028 domain-containing protein [Salinimicrobium catena]SDK74940.1 Uncharacterized conserved protein, Ntn-hydrolase superfamily [Salinimicrobium catena]SEE35201.1 Uncharacterized conserved protein, Ntn-hydrolase superfamily [Salinimicrobium catena]
MSIRNLPFVLFMTFSLSAFSQNAGVFKDQFAHTYSIVARDSVTGEMAVGVQSHWFSVGSLVPWGESGVGVVATQSFVNPAYGPQGLKLMEEGKTASEALGILIAQDEGKEFRQVAFLDNAGRTEAFTGKKCVEAADHITGKNFSVQANMMLNNEVVPAMELAFRSHPNLPLAERVLKVLEAAQQTGGDIRGKQSAALIVVGPEKVDNEWEDKRIDLRVDDHHAPVEELGRLLKVARAYEFMNKGDVAMEEENVAEALEFYGKAMEMFPENLEMQYWTAIALANSGRLQEAKPMFDSIFQQDENWREMTRRLPASGLLNISEEELEEIVN